MSHRTDQPLEITPSEVEHGYAVDDYAWGEGFFQLGTVKESLWWGSDEQADADFDDLDRRERARAKLGGFGFGGAHV